MTSASLRPCPACARHVRVNEDACPFCGEGLARSFRAGPRPQPPAVRLTRAALFAFGTGTLTLSPAGCGGAVSTRGGPGENDGTVQVSNGDAASDAAQTGVNGEADSGDLAMYGGPPFPFDQDCGTFSVLGLYGAPPFERPCETVPLVDAGAIDDATVDASTTGPVDAAADEHHVTIVASYGLPPI